MNPLLLLLIRLSRLAALLFCLGFLYLIITGFADVGSLLPSDQSETSFLPHDEPSELLDHIPNPDLVAPGKEPLLENQTCNVTSSSILKSPDLYNPSAEDVRRLFYSLNHRACVRNGNGQKEDVDIIILVMVSR